MTETHATAGPARGTGKAAVAPPLGAPAEENLPRRDSFGRAIRYLRLSVTDRCNLRCGYCVPSGGTRWTPREDHLTTGEVARLASLFARRGFSKIRITGGEPLVRPDIVELTAALAEIPEISDLPMSTNGILLARRAAALKGVGLSRVNVSLDTLDPAVFEKISGGDSLDRVWEGIHAALEAGLAPVKLNTVVQRGINDQEGAALARLTLGRALHVRFIEYMPVADFAAWKRGHVPNAEVQKAIEEQLGPLSPLASGDADGPARRYRLDGAAGTIGFISAITDDGFCERCNRVRLTATGRLRPCLYSPIEIDLRTPLRSGCDDETLDALLDRALVIKPASHELSNRAEEKTLPTMINLGG